MATTSDDQDRDGPRGGRDSRRIVTPCAFRVADELMGERLTSSVTGLVGFLQITWDANRQGLHDRIAGTVVVRE